MCIAEVYKNLSYSEGCYIAPASWETPSLDLYQRRMTVRMVSARRYSLRNGPRHANTALQLRAALDVSTTVFTTYWQFIFCLLVKTDFDSSYAVFTPQNSNYCELAYSGFLIVEACIRSCGRMLLS
jgi:hypothetical protein